MKEIQVEIPKSHGVDVVQENGTTSKDDLEIISEIGLPEVIIITNTKPEFRSLGLSRG
jgi:hypothetical protein